MADLTPPRALFCPEVLASLARTIAALRSLAAVEQPLAASMADAAAAEIG